MLHDGILTARGEQQIERVAQRLKQGRDNIVAVYTSPLGRAYETARQIAVAVDQAPQIQDDIKEMDFGELDSWTMQEIAEKRPDFFDAWRDFENRELIWPGGEGRRDFVERVTRGWDQIVAAHTEGSVVVVAHGGSLRVGIGHLLGWPATTFFSYNLYNCSLTRVIFEFERWRLLTLNDICHLEDLSDLG
jgi:broad specificity phosphatase PhoE